MIRLFFIPNINSQITGHERACRHDRIMRKDEALTDQAIEALTLKTIRKARKLGRPRLVRLAGITERQLSKLESGQGGQNLQPTTISKLATALAVPQGVLAGDMPMTDDDLTPMATSKCTSGCCG